MDYRARFPGMAPLTETGDPADCSWLTKAFTAECVMGSAQSDFDETSPIPTSRSLRIAQILSFAIVIAIVAYTILT